jgi:hypothetical protein
MFNYPSPERLCLLKPTFECLQPVTTPFSPTAEIRQRLSIVQTSIGFDRFDIRQKAF